MFIISDILSVLPSSNAGVAEQPPTIGSPAPVDPTNRLKFPLDPKRPIVLFFARHCGCPFAERDVHVLVDLLLRNPERFIVDGQPVFILIATHQDTTTSRAWFAEVLHAAYESSTVTPKPSSTVLQTHISLFPDPTKALHHAYSLGPLPTWSSLFSSEVLTSVKLLRSERGISNRKTGWGSDRWLSHGGVVVDAEGVVRWFWKAERAEEEGEWEEAVKSLGI